MQLIYNQRVNTPYLPLDVSGQRIAVVCAPGRIYTVWIAAHFLDFGKMFLVFTANQRLGCKPPVNIPVSADPHPFVALWGKIVGIEHFPQRFVTELAFVIFAVFVPEKACVGIDPVGRCAVKNAHLLHRAAPRTNKALFQPVPGNRRLVHIAVAGGLFGKHTVYRPVFLLIQSVKPVDIGDALNVLRKTAGDGFMQLPHPLPGKMRRTDHDVERLVICPPFGIAVLIGI